MDHLDRAWWLIDQNRFELAIKEAGEALRVAPDDWRCHHVLSEALRLLERWDEADEAARVAINVAPDLPHGHLALARVQVARGKTKNALDTLCAVSELAADDPDYWALLSQTHLRRWQAKAALAAARQGLALAPDHDGCRENEAIALIGLGRIVEADRALLASLRDNPNSSVNHHLRGAALLSSSQSKVALEHYEQALRLDPTDENARKGVIEAWRTHIRFFTWMHELASYVRDPLLRLGMSVTLVVGAVVWHKGHAEGPAGEDGGNTLVGALFILSLPDLIGWLSLPLFTLPQMLRSRVRRLLTRDEIRAAMVAGGWSLYVALRLAAAIYQGETMYFWHALVAVFAAVPCVVIFECRSGWPRHLMTCYAISLAGFALSGVHYGRDNEWILESVRYACLVGVPVAGWFGALLPKQE